MSAPALNASVRGPTVPVIVRLVNAARPFSSVSTLSVPPSVPPPEAIDTVTAVPLTLTAFPARSWSWTAGCGVKTTAFCTMAAGSVAMANFATGPALSVIVALVSGSRAPVPMRSRYAPTGPLNSRPLKVATPLASVVAVALVNVTPPGPVAIVAVTTTPA